MIRNRSPVLFLVSLLIVSVITPMSLTLVENAAYTSGRSVDVAIDQMEVISPSADISGTLTLAPGDHVIRVRITNSGTTPATGTLELLEGNDFASQTAVLGSQKSISVPAGGSEVHLLEYTKTGGTSAVTASVSASGDSEPANNQMNIGPFSIAASPNHLAVSDTIPSDSSTLASAPWVGNWVFTNTGNLNLTAEASLTLTPSAGGSSIDIDSSQTTAPAGSLASTAGLSSINLSVDATGLLGTYSLEGTIDIWSSLGVYHSEVIAPRNVVFSDAVATLSAPNNISVTPGSGTTLLFLLQNIGGVSDTFTLTYSDVQDPDWMDALNVSPLASVTVEAGEGQAITVPLDVPFNASRSDVDTITVTAVSTNTGEIVTARASVMAGDLFSSSLQSNGSVVYVDPGAPASVFYTLENTGTSPAHFQIDAGLQEVPTEWTVSVSPEVTDLVSPGETRAITIEVTTPSISDPLDPDHRNSAGSRLTLRVTSTPMQGDAALVASNITDIEVQASVSVTILPQGDLHYSTSDLELGNMAKALDVEVSLLSNFPTGSPGMAVVDLTALPTSFTSDDGASYGLSETTRWNATAAPESLNLQLGESATVVIGVLGPTSHPPALGILNFTITASTSLSGLTGITSPDTSEVFSVFIQDVIAAELEDSPIIPGSPGVQSNATLRLSNVGNALANFTLEMEELEGWDLILVNNSVTNLVPQVATFPSGFTVGTDITVRATPPLDARADEIHLIDVKVYDDEGRLMDNGSARFVLDEVIDGLLEPNSINMEIPILENRTQTAVFQIRNMGNSEQTFDLDIGSFVGGTDFTVSPLQDVTIPPGANSTQEVTVTALNSARADEIYSFDIILLRDGLEYDRIDVNIQIQQIHRIDLSTTDTFEAIPGEVVTLEVEAENLGNLREIGNLSFETPLGWTQTTTTFDIEPSSIITGLEISLTVPALTSEEVPMAGAIYDIPIIARNASDDIVVGSFNITVTIKPVFQLVFLDSPERIASLPNQDRAVGYHIRNAGNDAVTLSVSCTLDSSSVDRWSSPTCPSSLSLEQGEQTWINMTMRPTDDRHWNKETGGMTLRFIPQGDVGGEANWTTPLIVERVQTDEEIILQNSDGPVKTLTIDWMHVPDLTQTGALSSNSYEVRYVEGDRLLNSSIFPNTIWDFSLGSNQTSLVPGSIMTLGEASPYSPNSFDLRITLPNPTTIAPGDGWDLRFELHNVDEPSLGINGVTTFVVKLRMDSYTDPQILDVRFESGNLVEGTSTNLVVNVTNSGTAILPINSILSISCNGDVAINGSDSNVIPPLGIQESVEVTWEIEAASLPWYMNTNSFDCTFQLVLIDEIYGNDLANDMRVESLQIESWSPGFLPSLLGCILALFLSLFLFRRGLDDDERALFGSGYVAMVGLGLLSHTSIIPEIGLISVGFSVLWMFALAWIGSGELQAIHDDRRKAMLGERSALSSHEDELANTRREISWVLLGAPMLFVLVMMLDPSLTVDMTVLNIGSSLAYLVLISMMMIMAISMLERTYGVLHNQLAALDLRTQRIRGILESRSTTRTSAPPPPSPEVFSDNGGEEE